MSDLVGDFPPSESIDGAVLREGGVEPCYMDQVAAGPDGRFTYYCTKHWEFHVFINWHLPKYPPFHLQNVADGSSWSSNPSSDPGGSVPPNA